MRAGSDLRFVILGAGPTGLGAGYRLRELGVGDFQIYEALTAVGGLARSVVDPAGFTWDIGGHVLFSHYHVFDELMKLALGERWLHHARESWVWIENRFVPYPLQHNIRHLTPESRSRCLDGLAQLHAAAGGAARPANFGEWLDCTFGKGLAELFMRPYNLKVWAYPAEDLDYRWVAERVAVVDLEQLLDNVQREKDDVSWGPNSNFQFPLAGGTGAIWESVADLVGRERVSLSRAAVRIDPSAKRVVFADGSATRYDVLISTIPVDRLVDLAGLEPLKAHAGRLKHSSSHIVGVGLLGQPPGDLKKKCWMYFPEDNCPFYRVTVFSNYSHNNVPDITRHWSLMAEVSESPRKPVNGETIVQESIAGMRATGLIGDAQEIVSTWYCKAEYGYPTPSIGRDAALNAIHPTLESLGIYSRGRFGGWKYEVSNQDHSLMQGVELVDRLVLGTPEVTYRSLESVSLGESAERR